MLKTPELSMPRSRKFTTIYNGRREVWKDYEQAKAYFLEIMMNTEGEEHDRAECVYIQLLHGLDECSDVSVKHPIVYHSSKICCIIESKQVRRPMRMAKSVYGASWTKLDTGGTENGRNNHSDHSSQAGGTAS